VAIGMDLSIIILAYNDARSLPKLISRCEEVLSTLSVSFEIIVVDDASQDETETVIRNLDKTWSLRYVRHAHNRGVGAAFTTGLACAKGAVVGYLDGDAQYDPQCLKQLYWAIGEADAAIGWRVIRRDSYIRLAVSFIFNRLLRELFVMPLKDVNAGIKLFRRKSLATIQLLKFPGVFFDAEILIKGVQAGWIIRQLPVNHLPRKYGRSGALSIRSIREVISAINHAAMRPFVRTHVMARGLRQLTYLFSLLFRTTDNSVERYKSCPTTPCPKCFNITPKNICA